MIVKIVEKKNRYIFEKKDNSYILTPNGNLLEVKKKSHASLIFKEAKNSNCLKDPNSIYNLTNFSCNLNYDEKLKLKKKIIDLLHFDIVLFRCFEENDLLLEMDKELNPFMERFEKCFKLNLVIMKSLSEYTEIKSKGFYFFFKQVG